MSARVICIANQKGGVGKTTTSINLSAALAEIGRRVLLIDMDPQGNASSGLGMKSHDYEERSTYEMLVGLKGAAEVVTPTQVSNLDLVVATPDLVGAEIELVALADRANKLKQAISPVKTGYDYIMIDCPPSLGLLTLNSLVAADSFIVPLQCEYFALEGLSQLLNTAGIIKKNQNTELQIEGIVLTMFDTRNNLSHQVMSEIKNHFGDKVFTSIIPRNVRLSEAPSHGRSILEYDGKSIGANRYKSLARELDERVERRKYDMNTQEMSIQVSEPLNTQPYDLNTQVSTQTHDLDTQVDTHLITHAITNNLSIEI